MTCPRCKCRSTAIGWAWSSDQRPIFPRFCLHCGHVHGPYATKREADAYAKAHGTLVRVHPATQGGK